MHNFFYFIHLGITICGIIFIFHLAKKQKLPQDISPGRSIPIWAFLCAVPALFLLEFISFKATWPPAAGWDYLNAYYLAGRAVLEKPAGLHSLLEKGTIGFVNIPIVAYAFAPFALIPARTSAIVFALFGFLSVVSAWYFLARLANLELRERWLLAFLFLVNGPLISGIKYGNLSYFILAAMAGGLWLLRSDRPGLAGVLLGVATVIKPPLALFGFFFLFRREWRGLAGYTATGLATILLSLLVFGWSDNFYWFETSIVQYSHTWLDAFNVQSITAFIQRLTDGAGLREWQIATSPTTNEKLAAQFISVLLLLVGGAACLKPRFPKVEASVRLKAERQDLQFLLVICLCLVSSPLAWTHYYLWLLMPIAFFLSWGARGLPRWAFWTGWVAIIMVSPIAGNAWSLSNEMLMALYRVTVVSHYLIGGLLIFVLAGWRLASTGGLLPLIRGPNSQPQAMGVPKDATLARFEIESGPAEATKRALPVPGDR